MELLGGFELFRKVTLGLLRPNLLDPTPRPFCLRIREALRVFIFILNKLPIKSSKMFGGRRLLPKQNQTEEACIRAVEEYAPNLVRVNHQTPAICRAAIHHRPHALQFVREKTEDLCLLALQSDGLTLQFISEPTEEMLQTAIQQNAFAIEFVRNPTEDLLRNAIRQNACVLSLFPHADPELYLYAMEFQAEKWHSGHTVSGAYCVRYQSPQTKEVALAGVKRNGRLLKWIQEPLKCDPEILTAAIEREPYALQYVPTHCFTEELCWLSIRTDKYCIKFVPSTIQTMEMVDFCADNEDAYGFVDYIALRHLTKSIVTRLCIAHPWCIKHIPLEKLSSAICKRVVEIDGECLQFVPVQFLGKRLIWKALLSKPTAIEFVPDKLKTKGMCQHIVEMIGQLSSVPKQFRTPVICQKAVRKDPGSILFVPNPTAKLCTIAVLQKPELFLKLPKHLRTPEIALLAVERNGRLLESKKFPQTEQICIAAIQNNWRSFYHVQTRTPAIEFEAVKAHKPLIVLIPHPTEEMLAL